MRRAALHCCLADGQSHSDFLDQKTQGSDLDVYSDDVDCGIFCQLCHHAAVADFGVDDGNLCLVDSGQCSGLFT